MTNMNEKNPMKEEGQSRAFEMDKEMEASEQILKRDVIGRVQTPQGLRERIVDEFERSGMSGREFARMAGMKYPTFASWVQKRRRANGVYEAVKRGECKLPHMDVGRGKRHTAQGEIKQLANSKAFMEAVVDVAQGNRGEGNNKHRKLANEQGAGNKLRVALPGGASLEVGDVWQAKLAVELLRALAGKEGVGC
jgi:DNA-binding transcriptional regulator YiaG